ncbi:MAG: nucleotidyltransferase family protein [candidate division KSB1 bacterium]|nr:nucleotidyltransferase family protein [candidate division KSB1 bacterium]MDZ7304158.1 nucleotidyltransferase family protein [candidate division KSB1 bacterium]MDZ7310631.1 nucleotidyltransferase family protein [candidate division KSB1 bacterium]
MDRNEIFRILREHRTELEQFGVKSLALFGSAARDEIRPDSDVDFLVEFEGPATFDQYMNLKFFLEDLLGRQIDLVTRKALKPRLRPYIEKEMLYVT